MAGLSPEAQAVLDAFTGNDTIHGLHLMLPRLAAALRAATDQLLIRPDVERSEYSTLMRLLDRQFRAIATELEGNP